MGRPRDSSSGAVWRHKHPGPSRGLACCNRCISQRVPCMARCDSKISREYRPTRWCSICPMEFHASLVAHQPHCWGHTTFSCALRPTPSLHDTIDQLFETFPFFDYRDFIIYEPRHYRRWSRKTSSPDDFHPRLS